MKSVCSAIAVHTYWGSSEMNLFRLFLACISVVFFAGKIQASITITDTLVGARASKDSFGFDLKQFIGETIPTSTTLNAVDGNAYSKTVINWSVSGNQTILSFGMDHRRTGVDGSEANSPGTVRFTANANLPYEFSGYYNVSDFGVAGYVLYDVSLLDLNTSLFVFENRQDSGSTSNERFLLGEVGGDTSNSLSGSSTGNLIAGHDYRIDFEAYIYALTQDAAGASALGNLTLTIGTTPKPGDFNHDNMVNAADYVFWRKTDGTPAGYNAWRANFGKSYSAGSGTQFSSVPEPSTLLLLDICAIGLVGSNGRRR